MIAASLQKQVDPALRLELELDRRLDAVADNGKQRRVDQQVIGYERRLA